MSEELKEDKLDLGAKITDLIVEFRKKHNVEVTNLKLHDQGLLGCTFVTFDTEPRPEFDGKLRCKIGEEQWRNDIFQKK
jgi:hypothetical protein